MASIKSFAFLLLLICATQKLTAQECYYVDRHAIEKEVLAIPGETMGQKLESLLFWSQDEKERRFSMMQAIYPSIPIPTGNKSSSLEELGNMTPKWEDETTLVSYMKDNHVQGIVVLQDNKIRIRKVCRRNHSRNTLDFFLCSKIRFRYAGGCCFKRRRY